MKLEGTKLLSKFADLAGYIMYKFLVLLSIRRPILIVHFPTNSIGRLLPDFEEFFSDVDLIDNMIILGFFDKAVVNRLVTDYITSKICIMPNQLMVRVETLIDRSNNNFNLKNYSHGKGHFYPNSILNSSQFKVEFGQFLNSERHKYTAVPRINSPYVTLCIREPTEVEVNDNLRNSSVTIFDDSVRFLLGQGFAIARMSRDAQTPISRVSSDCIVDYPFTNFKSDFADFALFKDSLFCISTGFGVDHFASFFEIPVLTINCALMATYLRVQKRFFLPKVFISCEKGFVLSVDEIVDRKLHLIQNDRDLKKEGVELVDNSDLAMKLAIQEFIDNDFFLNKNINKRYFELSSRLASAQFSYFSEQFGTKEKHFSSNFDLASLILISEHWPNFTSPGLRYEKRTSV
jgi:putative glycosyltransferase (TIGR04372 family)